MTNTNEWPSNTCTVIIKSVADGRLQLMGQVSKCGSTDPDATAEAFASILKPGHTVEVWHGPANGNAEAFALS